MPDINTYSLSIQLNLESNATTVLGGVSDQLTTIYKQIVDISKAWKELDEPLTQHEKIWEKMAEHVEDVKTDFTEFQKAYTEKFANPFEEHEPMLKRVVKAIRHIALEMHHTRMDTIKIDKAILRTAKQMKLTAQTSEVIAENMGEAQRGFAGVSEQAGIGGARAEKLRRALADLGPEFDEIVRWQLLSNANLGRGLTLTKQWTEGTKAVGANIKNMFLGWQAVTGAMADLAKYEEDFITANYRLYGTQTRLVEKVTSMVAWYRVLRKEAHAAYKVLAIGLRTSLGELEKAVLASAMFARVTGVSIDTIGEWMRSMRLAGFSAREGEHGLAMLASAMRSAGLTTEQVSNIMRDDLEQTSGLALTMGKDNVIAYQNMRAASVALVRAQGGNADAMRELYKAMTSNIVVGSRATKMAQNYRAEIAQLPPELQKVGKYAYGSYGIVKQFGEMIGGFAKYADRPEILAELAEGYKSITGISGTAMKDLALVFKDMSVDQLTKELQKQYKEIKKHADLTALWRESMNALQSIWQRVVDKTAAAWMTILTALRPILLLVGIALEVLAFALQLVANLFYYLLMPLQWVEAAFRKVAEGIGKLVDIIKHWLAPAISAINKGFEYMARQWEAVPEWIKEVIRYVGGLIGSLAGLVVILPLVFGSFNVLRGVFRLLLSPLKLLGTLFSGLTRLFMGGVAVVGRLVAAIGAGLRSLIAVINSINPLPLLALAVAIIAVGVAAYLLAKALKIITKAGWGAVAALLGLLVAFSTVIGGLMVLSAVAAPLQPILWPLVALFIALGIAAVLLGAAFWLVAQGIVTIAKAIKTVSAGEIILWAGAFMALGLSVIVAAGLILGGAVLMIPAAALMGVAMIALAIALWLVPVSRINKVAAALNALGEGFKKAAAIAEGAGSLKEATSVIKEFAKSLSGVAAEIAPAAIQLYIAGALVRYAMIRLAWAILIIPVDRTYAVAGALGELSSALGAYADAAQELIAAMEGADEAAEGLYCLSAAIQSMQSVNLWFMVVGFYVLARGVERFVEASDGLSEAAGALSEIAEAATPETATNLFLVARALNEFGSVGSINLLFASIGMSYMARAIERLSAIDTTGLVEIADSIKTIASVDPSQQLLDSATRLMESVPVIEQTYKAVAQAISNGLDEIAVQSERAKSMMAPLESIATTMATARPIEARPREAVAAESISTVKVMHDDSASGKPWQDLMATRQFRAMLDLAAHMKDMNEWTKGKQYDRLISIDDKTVRPPPPKPPDQPPDKPPQGQGPQ